MTAEDLTAAERVIVAALTRVHQEMWGDAPDVARRAIVIRQARAIAADLTANNYVLAPVRRVPRRQPAPGEQWPRVPDIADLY